MKQVILFILFFFLFVSSGQAKHIHPEKYYQDKWCKAHDGVAGVWLGGKQIDCLTATHAVEVEFAGFKNYESVGQVQRYMRLSKRKRGGILYILESPELIKYVDETIKDINHHKLKIDIWTIEK